MQTVNKKSCLLHNVCFINCLDIKHMIGPKLLSFKVLMLFALSELVFSETTEFLALEIMSIY